MLHIEWMKAVTFDDVLPQSKIQGKTESVTTVPSLPYAKYNLDLDSYLQFGLETLLFTRTDSYALFLHSSTKSEKKTKLRVSLHVAGRLNNPNVIWVT